MAPTVAERTVKTIAEQGGISIDRVTPDKGLADDLAFDSLERVELVMTLEDEFEIVIDDEDAAPLVTVGDVVAMVERLVGAA